MTGLTDYLSACLWEDIIIAWDVLVDDASQALERHYGKWRKRGSAPEFGDSEVITIGLSCDTFFDGSEELGLSFVRQHYSHLFPHLLENSRFNRRRRELGPLTEQIRRYWTLPLIDPDDPIRLTDSAPIPVCTYMRGSRCQTVQGADYCSVIPSKRAKLFGFRVYVSATIEQLVEQWMLAPAAPHENKVAEVFFEDTEDQIVFADNAFRDAVLEFLLKQQRNIALYATPRKSDTRNWPEEVKQLFTRMRRRVETALSVLTTVFHLERPGSRSLKGLVARVSSCFLAYSLSFVIALILESQFTKIN